MAEFTGTKTDTACPNCGSNLYSGLADGNILVCRNENDEGCNIAVDPDHPEGETAAPHAVGVSEVEASPEVGPPNNPTEVPAPDVFYQQESLAEPWKVPTSAPQAVNAGEEAAPVQETTPAPEPTEPGTPPSEPAPEPTEPTRRFGG